MKILVTGSAGHLGEGLVRTLEASGKDVVGLDILESPFTHIVGSITDRARVRHGLRGVDAVVHTATLHKPHIVTHRAQDFVDTNVTGTLVLLEEAVAAGVEAFVFTSTTSAFGGALRPPESERAAWVTEALRAIPRNIYGVTKTAAEDLCELFHRQRGLACVILRASRFFPEEDDHEPTRRTYEHRNVQVNELLYRRADLADVVDVHLLALEQARAIGFERLIVSATTPFRREDLSLLRRDAPSVLARRFPDYAPVYERLGWRMFPAIDRVYVNDRARSVLGWQPKHDFAHAIARLRAGEDFASPLARLVGAKGYHGNVVVDGRYPVV